jgi:hypothetical protein
MQSVTYKPFMLSVVMLNVVTLNVVAPKQQILEALSIKERKNQHQTSVTWCNHGSIGLFDNTMLF